MVYSNAESAFYEKDSNQTNVVGLVPKKNFLEFKKESFISDTIKSIFI